MLKAAGEKQKLGKQKVEIENRCPSASSAKSAVVF